MEAKKNPNLDLGNYHGLLFNIGLFVSLALANVAMEWRQTDSSTVNLVFKSTNTFETLVEVPITKTEPPPPELAVVQPKIVEVSNEELVKTEMKIDFNIEVNEQTRVADVVYQPAPAEPEPEDTDKIFVVVEQVAAPQGGLENFYKSLAKNLKYPSAARHTGVEGRVFVQFIVNKDGSLSDFTIAKGIGAGCDEEAIRIIQEGPKWAAAKQRGKPVRQRMVLPVFFMLAQR
ncbi:MAG: TonB family protein [Flammeovirgaceae bacterium]